MSEMKIYNVNIEFDLRPVEDGFDEDEEDKDFAQVVELAAVDEVIAEAVFLAEEFLFWAKFHKYQISQAEVDRAQAFLSSPTVTGWRERQKLDNCSVCKGANGGVPGNENIVDGVVICDYCHAVILEARQNKERGDEDN